MNRFILIALLLSAATLAACSDVKETVGLGRRNPDEFAVVKNPPLSMPPEFDLRPPNSGAKGAAAAEPAQETARTAVLGAQVSDETNSSGLNTLLTNAGASNANPKIRSTLDEETAGVVVKDPGFVDRLMIWDHSSKKPDPAIDADAEAQRINDAKSKSDFISGDGIKIPDTKPQAPLEGIFN